MTPSALTWSSVPVGGSGNAQQVTVTNDSSSNISVNMAMSGDNAGDFLISTTTCGTTLFAGSSCGANVVFSPTATGARSATLTLIRSGGQPTQVVALSGDGVAAINATASPSAPPLSLALHPSHDRASDSHVAEQWRLRSAH